MKDATSAIRLQTEQTAYREHSVPMFLTSSFTFDSAEHAESMFAGELEGDIYSRFSNPNCSELINKMCALEQVESGVATASGMAAIFNSLAAHLKAGDHVVAASSLFGNTLYILKNILPSWGIETTFVDLKDQSAWEQAFKANTKMVLVETPTNPSLELIDLKWLSELTHQHQAILAVDNCFATPIVQKPALFGADLIIHSATKFIDGQGRVLGGLVLGKKELTSPVYDFLRRTGSSLSPFNAWVLSKSLETLDLRVERHCNNAFELAKRFEKHEKLNAVRYPFLQSHEQHELAKQQMSMGGGLFTIDVKGGKKACFEFINQIKLLSITANLGDTRTIVTHPATTTHSKLSEADRLKAGITDGTIRISVGLEHVDDIYEDLNQALKHA